MKTYGVNWFLVWFGFLLFMGPLSAWLGLFLFSPWHLTPNSHEITFVQGFCQPFCWTGFLYFTYDKTLSDPKAIERLRHRIQQNRAARYRRYRWLITWVVVFAVVAILSVTCKVIFNQPSWLSVVSYSFLLPCSCLADRWLIDEVTRKGQLAQLLKVSD